MNETKHTLQLPLEPLYDGDATRIWDADCHRICTMSARNSEANAHYIVQACNEFPAMVEALRLVLSEVLHRHGPKYKGACTYSCVYCDHAVSISALLARIEGGISALLARIEGGK